MEKNCKNCGERQGCHHFLEGKTPIKCKCYWNSDADSFKKLEELMKKNKDMLDKPIKV